MNQKIPVIYNPAAGSKNGVNRRRLEKAFSGLGAGVELMATAGPDSARKLAAEVNRRGAGRLIVAGGDGTINEAINGLAGGDTELAIIPTGTANVLALELEIPFKLEKACSLALEGSSVPVDLGLAGRRYFILMAGIGYDALVIKNINPMLKRTIRRAAFPFSGIGTFFREELSLLSIRTDDYKTEGYFVIASNARYYGGRFGPNPKASMTDGLLDVCVLKGQSLPEMLNFWLGAFSKGTIDSAVAESFRTPEVEITCPPGASVPIQTDGEVVDNLPVRVSIAPKALRVCPGDPNW